MANSAFPYQCAECEQQPAAAFTLFEEDTVSDWLMAYPHEQAIHIHFGYSTPDEAVNIREAQFTCQFLMRVAADHPGRKFFIFVDFTRGDNSESVPPESMKLYRAVLKHEQLRHGVIYGGTTALHYLLELLFRVSGNYIKIVPDKAQADQEYQNWLKQQAA